MTEASLTACVGYLGIVDLVAAGGMGEVCLACDERRGRKAELKGIRLEHHTGDQRQQALSLCGALTARYERYADLSAPFR